MPARADADIKARERAKGPRGTNAWLDTVCSSSCPTRSGPSSGPSGHPLFITFMALMATRRPFLRGTRRASRRTTVAFVNLMWQCVFVFLPLMVAYNASAKIGADPWVGFAIMAVLMLPGFSGLAAGVDKTPLFGFGSKRRSRSCRSGAC